MKLLLFNLATDADDPILGFTSSWIRVLASRLEHIDVITMRAGRIDVPENVQVHSVGKERGAGEFRRALNFYSLLQRVLRESRPDVCLAHMMPLFALMGAPLLKTRGVRTMLWYAHGSTPSVLRLASKVVDRIGSSSPEGFRVPGAEVVVTGQGIDTELFAPDAEVKADDRFRIVAVGRIAPIKRLDVAIDAIAALNRTADPQQVTLRLVGPVLPGDQDHADSLKRLVSELGLAEVVEFVGAAAPVQVAAEYRRAHLALNLSDTDSLDKAGLEAMSCGLPLVTSNAALSALVREVSPSSAVPKGDPSRVASACEAWRSAGAERRRAEGSRFRSLVVKRHGLQQLADRLVSELSALCAKS